MIHPGIAWLFTKAMRSNSQVQHRKGDTAMIVEVITEIRDLVRPAILKMNSYSSGRQAGVRPRYRLDANENLFPPYPATVESEGRQYYEEQQLWDVIERMSRYYGVPVEQLLMTRGADESINLLVRSFCEADKDSL